MMLAGAAALPIAQGPVIPHYERASSCIRENGQFCFSWFVDNFDRVFVPRLVEHIWLTLLAVGIGFAIAFTAALVAYTLDWFETPFAILAAFLYTIPSLAFFQLLVPITGLTVTSAEIALVSYTILILFRNTLTGLREVPEDARLAARAMGLTKGQILRRVELPLALPLMFAGIRISAVNVVATATIAPLAGVTTLGDPIINVNTYGDEGRLAAAIVVALLAVATEVVLGTAQRAVTPRGLRVNRREAVT